MTWYPGERKKREDYVRVSKKVVCPVCEGKGWVVDAKTKKGRDCVMCVNEKK